MLKYEALPVYVINYDEKANMEVLEKLAIYSGGAVFFKPGDKSLKEFYSLLHKDLTGKYSLRFRYPFLTPTNLPGLIEVLYIKDKFLIDKKDILYKYPDKFN
jgi:hypothetical protein